MVEARVLAMPPAQHLHLGVEGVCTVHAHRVAPRVKLVPLVPAPRQPVQLPGGLVAGAPCDKGRR